MRILLSVATVTISHKARLLQQLDDLDHARKKLLADYNTLVDKLNKQIRTATAKYDADVLDLNLKATGLTAEFNESQSREL